MPSEDYSMPGVYLLRQLGSDARPFAYRSGVYRLLGLTLGAETRLGFLPPLPSVGFQFLQPGEPPDVEPAPEALPRVSRPPPRPGSQEHFMAPATSEPVPRSSGPPAGPEAPDPPESFGILDGFQPGAPRGIAAAALVPATGVAPQPHTAEPREPRLVRPHAGSPTSSGAAGIGHPPDPYQPGKGSSPAASPQTPVAVPRSVGLALPGVTERRTVFASLAGQPAREEETGATPARERPPRDAAPAEPTLPPADPRERTAAPAGPTDLFAARPELRGPTAWKPALEPPVRRALPITGEEDVDPDPPRRDRAATPGLSGERPPGLVPALPRTDPVEQLRRAAVRRAARQSPPSAGAEEEIVTSRRAVSPPAARQVVVVRATARPSTELSRAFWSSSILRSRHLGVLR
jgi:hypothetical protein